MCLDDTVKYFQIAAYGAAFTGIIFTAVGYIKNNKLKRGEWLQKLFEKFYEQKEFKEIRRQIEYGGLGDYLDLDEKSEPKKHDREEEFVNYLNFFEFIAILKRKQHVRKSEINDLFGYYLKKLNDVDFIRNYINQTNHGFENLSRLLKLNEYKQ